MPTAQQTLGAVPGFLASLLRVFVLIGIAATIIAAVAFPSDYFFGYKVKSMALALGVFSSVIAIPAASRPVPLNVWITAAAIVFAATMLLLFGLYRGAFATDLVLRDVELTMITIAIPFFIVTVSLAHDLVTARRIVTFCIIGLCIYASWKIALEVIGVEYGMRWIVMQAILAKAFQLLPNAGELGGGLFRISYVGDMVCAVALIFLFPHIPPHIHLPMPVRIIAGILLLAAVISGWSRFNMVFALVNIFLGATSTMKPQRVLIPIVAMALTAATVIVLSPDVSKAVVDRFAGKETAELSDEPRIEQTAALLGKFSDSVVFGFGPGAFVPSIIRGDYPFTYEVQVLSLLMRYGLIGGVIIVLFLGYVIYMLSGIRPIGARVVLLTAFLLFIVANFTNAYLMSSPMSIVWLMFFTAIMNADGVPHANLPIQPKDA